MNIRAATTLRELSFNPDEFIDCPEIALLEDWLINIDKINILSQDEVKALEYAELIAPEEISNKLKEYGIVEEEDIWESDELAIQNLRNKLRSLEAETLDDTIDVLRVEKGRLKQLEKELTEKFEAADLTSHISDCEEKWKRIQIELQQLVEVFEEFVSINQHNDGANKFQEFSKSFEKELNEFVTQVNQYVDKTWSGIKVNTGTTSQNDCKNEENKLNVKNREDISRQSNGFEISQTVNMEQRLTCLYFNCFEIAKTTGSNGILIRPLLEIILRNLTDESMDLKKWENNDDILLNLSRKKAQLQMKVEGTLPLLEGTKAQRESWSESSQNLLQILEKQEILMELVKMVQFLWNKENNVIHEALSYCYTHFQEEVAKITVRMTGLENHQKKFELFFNDGLIKQNLCQQMLENVPEWYYSARVQSLSDRIVFYEDDLQMILNNQDTLIQNSKKQLSVIKERVDQMQDCINVKYEKLFEIEYGFNSAQDAMNTKKEERISILNGIAEDSEKCIQRLLWIHFLTDINKLKEQLIERTENYSLSFMENLRFTSTPEGNK